MTHSRGLLEEGLWPDDEDPLRPDTHSEDEAIEYYLGPEDDGPEPEPEEDEEPTWSRYNIFAHGYEGQCSIAWATNDDDDDGYPGPDDYASANYGPFPNIWEALKFTSGGSRAGCAGCVVTVTINNFVTYTLTEDYQHYRPYCPWPRRRPNEGQS